MVKVSDDFFDATRRRCAALNRFIVDIAYSNWRFGFELARAKTLSDVLTLQAEYRRRLFNAFYRGEFRNWPVEAGEPASPVNVEAGDPASAVDQDESATAKPSPPQKERKTAKRPVTGTAFKKPEQKPDQGAKRTAAKHASAVEKNAEKIRAEPKEHRPHRKADAGASKRPARQDARGRRDEIHFGRLDDSAVRFSNREAWRLRSGKWRRIPVDKAL